MWRKTIRDDVAVRRAEAIIERDGGSWRAWIAGIGSTLALLGFAAACGETLWRELRRPLVDEERMPAIALVALAGVLLLALGRAGWRCWSTARIGRTVADSKSTNASMPGVTVLGWLSLVADLIVLIGSIAAVWWITMLPAEQRLPLGGRLVVIMAAYFVWEVVGELPSWFDGELGDDD